MKTHKVCLIGDFGVGKTSLVAQLVRSIFSDKYLTTVGVKIDTKELVTDTNTAVKLIIWDIAGTDTATTSFTSYLKGAHGLILVADSTRLYTVENILNLHSQLAPELQKKPYIGLLNKADLSDACEITPALFKELNTHHQEWLFTSAKTADNVEAAFVKLASQL